MTDDATLSDDKAAAGKPARQRPAVPKWESAARERVRTAIRRFARPLADLRDRDANEGDTRLIVTDFLCDALGYDKYENLTTEYRVKGEFADYGVRIDKQLEAFIEVKRISTKLNERHLRQVLSYAVNEGVEWVMLTNGQVWQAYHITAGLPVQVDKAIEVDLLGDGTASAKADDLFYLTIEAARRDLMDAVWKEQAATSPGSLARACLDPSVVEAIRRQVRRSTGHNADGARIADVLRDEVIRPELLR
jgi:hypothetical protein